MPCILGSRAGNRVWLAFSSKWQLQLWGWIPLGQIHGGLVLNLGRLQAESVSMAPSKPITICAEAGKEGNPVSQSFSQHTW